jgi:hypothetical protein
MSTRSPFGALTANSAASRYDAPRASGTARYEAPRRQTTAPRDTTTRAPRERVVTTRYATTVTRSTIERRA